MNDFKDIRFTRRSLLKASAVGTALGATAMFPSYPASARVLFRLNHQLSAQTLGSQVDAWIADQITERTDGKVEIKIFWSEGLGKATENLSLLKNHAIDMAAFSPAYFPAQLPFFAAPNSIPMALDGPKQAQTLMARLVDRVPAYREEQKANGIRLRLMHIINPYILISKKPITTLEDMAGLKVRTWGEYMPRMMKALGATPDSMSVPEIYENLSRGVIDACPFAIDLMVTYKLYEVARHVTNVTLWCGVSYGIWITGNSWAKLTPEQQGIVLDVYKEAQVLDLKKANEAASSARKKLKSQGVAFHTMSDSEKNNMKKTVPDFRREWVVEMDKAGKGDDAREAAKIWDKVVANVPAR